MENEFLHKINVSKVLEETGLDILGLSKLINVDSQSIYRWAWDKSKSGNRPKYNAIVRLLENGATVETLFGVDYKGKPKDGQSIPREFLDNPEFQEGVKLLVEDVLKRKEYK